MKIIIHNNNNLNDIFTFQDNISDFSFLLLSENKLFEIEISENNKSNSNHDKGHIKVVVNQMKL